MRQVILDTETTGLSPESGDRVLEIGCVEIVNRRLTGRNLHFYLNPERRSHQDAIAVHGLSEEFLADKPLFAQIADELLEYLKDAEIIIHNAAFDVGFLDAELRRLERPAFSRHVGRIVDSLSLARESFPGKSNSLDALCKRLEVDNSNRTLHGALLDAGLLAEVYIRMTRGQETLAILDDDDSVAGALAALNRIDLAAFTLPVLLATDDEAAAHEVLLVDLDKASGGKTLWRALVA
jgi:DNA polymerase-3 subunit epsilon